MPSLKHRGPIKLRAFFRREKSRRQPRIQSPDRWTLEVQKDHHRDPSDDKKFYHAKHPARSVHSLLPVHDEEGDGGPDDQAVEVDHRGRLHHVSREVLDQVWAEKPHCRVLKPASVPNACITLKDVDMSNSAGHTRCIWLAGERAG